MNIGIDIDGVLCSEDLFQLVYGMKYCCEKRLNSPEIFPFLSETKSRFNWSSEDDRSFWKTNYLYYLTTSEFIYPSAVDVIQDLYWSGHSIYIITQRNQSLLTQLDISENMEELTKDWLNKNNIPFHQLILTEHPKQFVIRELNITLMIDDNLELLMDISKYIKVIGFRAHCNLQYFLPNIQMVSSWKELKYKILNM